MRVICFLVFALGLLLPSLARAHDDEHDERIVPRYPSYPYAKHTKGYVRRVPIKDSGGDDARLWSVRIGADGAYLGKQGWSAGGRALLRYWRLGLSANAQLYSGWGDTRPFYLGGANATLDLVMRPHFGLRVGPGVIARADAHVPGGSRPSYEYGSNVLTEVDVLPIHPVVAGGRFEVGRIGDLVTVSGRVSVGVMIRRFEISLAYEAKRVGDMSLRGPQLGLRAWF